MAANKARSRTKFSDAVPNPGPGMFVDVRAIASAERAVIALEKLSRDEKFRSQVPQTLDAASLEVLFLDISSTYWSDFDYDGRLRYAEMTKALAPIRRRIRRLTYSLKHLQRPLVVFIERNLIRSASDVARGERVARVVAELEKIDGSLDPVFIRTLAAKSRSLRGEHACKNLWEAWEKVVGQKFLRSWEIGTGESGLKEFVKADAWFVQTALQAIDPDTKIAEIRSSLKRVAASQPKSGSHKKRKRS